MRAVVNGQLVEINPGSTVNDLKKSFSSIDQGETIVMVSGTKAEVQSDNALVEAGRKYRSIPAIRQG